MINVLVAGVKPNYVILVHVEENGIFGLIGQASGF